jgi:CubicO group peptidase (beta-lactamase class C family)
MGSRPEFDTLDDLVQHQLTEHQIPGIAVGTLIDGDIRTSAFGTINLNTGYPTRPDTLFQIGSISKVFTATLAMRLVEEGKLNLDTPVAEYLPDLELADPAAREVITTRQLLTHTSGLEGDIFEDYGVGDDALALYVANAASWKQETPPGEQWSYCNSGFSLAGRVIEAITGQGFEQVMRERVFEPLGLTHACYYAQEAIVHSAAAGHLQLPGEDAPRVAQPYLIARCSNAAGGIMANLRDVLTFARFHLGDGTVNGARVLESASVTEMQRSQKRISSVAERGIAWGLSEYGDTMLVGHTGGTNGHITQLVLVPEHSFAMAVLTNSSRGGSAIQPIIRWALERYLGVRNEPPASAALSEDELAQYTGRYPSTLTTTTVTVDGSALKLAPRQTNPFSGDEFDASPVTIIPLGDDEFYNAEGDSRVEFVRDNDGIVAFMRFGGRLAARQA